MILLFISFFLKISLECAKSFSYFQSSKIIDFSILSREKINSKLIKELVTNIRQFRVLYPRCTLFISRIGAHRN